MSIINDALKKAQQHLKEQATTPPEQNSAAQTSPSQDPPLSVKPTVKKTLASIEEQEEKQREQIDSTSSVKKKPSLTQSPQKPSTYLPMLIVVFLLSLLGALFIYYPQYRSHLSFLSNIKIPSFFSKKSNNSKEKVFHTVQPDKDGRLPAIVTINSSSSQQQEKTHHASENFHLQGIFSKDNKNVALINDGVYEIGAQIENHTVLRIEENFVEIQSPKGEIKKLTIR